MPNTAQGGRPLASPPPELAETCPSLRELYMAGELEWSEGEPAINVYRRDGRFSPHTDHLALTVLVPLSCPEGGFDGGGTGFWARDKVLSDSRTYPDPLPTPTRSSTRSGSSSASRARGSARSGATASTL